MKLKVTNDFTDKNDNKLYKKGQVIEVTEKRAKEILNSPYNVAEGNKEL